VLKRTVLFTQIVLMMMCFGQEWELVVLQTLKWDVSSVTAHDFIEHIVRRLPLTSPDDVDTVRRHALAFIALCTAGTIQTALSGSL